MTLQQLADLIGASLEGDGALTVSGIAPIDQASPSQVTFLSNKKYERHLADTRAAAVIVADTFRMSRGDIATLRMKDPYLGFVRSLHLFHPAIAYDKPGVHPSAVLHETAVLGKDVTIAANAVLGEGVVMGDRSVIAEGVVLRKDVRVGEDCLLYPNVTVLDRCAIGNRVIIHAGTTIGSDGFGFAPEGKEYRKIPQVGAVRIEDDVEIGANCAIDRGALGDTIIRRGCKLDNLIQIAHNVELGENTVIAAQSGISGSTHVGTHVIIAGQVGIVGHIDIGDDVTVSAQSGVSRSLHGPGKVFRGSPAREIHEELRQEAAQRQLPELIQTVRALEQRLRQLEQQLHDNTADA